jgi:hypothetical protein
LALRRKPGQENGTATCSKGLDPTARKVMAFGFIPPTDDLVHSHRVNDNDKKIKFIFRAFCYENTSDVHIKIHF